MSDYGECDSRYDCDARVDDLVEAQRKIDALTARCAELEKDAARYRWLIERYSICVGLEFNICGSGWITGKAITDHIDATRQPDADTRAQHDQ